MGVALVEAPPHPTVDLAAQSLGRDFLKPFPRQRAFSHAADGDDVEEADVREFRLRDPLGEQAQFVLPADDVLGLEQGVGMGDVGLGCLRDGRDTVELMRDRLPSSGFFRHFPQLLTEGVDDQPAQVFRRVEGLPNAAFADATTQRIDAVARAVDHLFRDRVIVVHQKDEDRDSALDGAVELHLGDRDFVPFWDVPVAPSEDSDVNVGFVDQSERFRDRSLVSRRQLLHREGHRAAAQTGVTRLLSMFGQVDRGAADHHLLDAGAPVGGFSHG